MSTKRKAKTRLNMGHRDLMFDFAMKSVNPNQGLHDKLNAAYEKAEKLIRQGLAKKYPETDLVVLRKYEMTTTDACINVKVEDESSHFEPFRIKYEDESELPEVPDTICYNRVYWFGVRCGQAVKSWELLRVEYREAQRQVRNDFKALIWGARYFEDVAVVWPKFEEMREQIAVPGTSLTTLSEETIQRISDYNVAA